MNGKAFIILELPRPPGPPGVPFPVLTWGDRKLQGGIMFGTGCNYKVYNGNRKRPLLTLAPFLAAREKVGFGKIKKRSRGFWHGPDHHQFSGGSRCKSTCKGGGIDIWNFRGNSGPPVTGDLTSAWREYNSGLTLG